ncbi:hypothetical protein VSQ48_13900 [Candidatus Ventrimonas sp. KK005]
MKSSLDKIHPNTLGTICFSEDESKMFGFSKYYNEFFEINLSENSIRSLGMLENEEDEFDLVFMMVYCCGKILFIPRNAHNFHLYDMNTQKQKIISLKDRFHIENFDVISFFSFVQGRTIYLFYRANLSVYKFDIDSENIEHLKQPYEQSERVIWNAAAYKSKIALFAKKSEEVFIFDGLRETMDLVILNEEVTSYTTQYYDGTHIWLYHFSNNKVYQCDLKGVLIKTFHLSQSLKKDGLSLRFYSVNDKLFLIPNMENYYYELSNDKLQIRYFQQENLDEDVRYLISENEQYQYLISFPINKMNTVLTSMAYIPHGINYKRWNKKTWIYEDCLIPGEKDKDINGIRNRIYNACIKKIPSICNEGNLISLETYTDILTLKDNKNSNKISENQYIKKDLIYKTIMEK